MKGEALKTVLLGLVMLLLMSCATPKERWDYQGEYAPEHWDRVSEEARICRTGELQSPISLHHGEAKARSQQLHVYYHKADLIVVNNGHTVEFDTTDSHYIGVDGVIYKLTQFHFHSHSEHKIDGKVFPAEMHLVHRSDKGQLMVLAVHLEVSEGSELAHIFDAIPAHNQKVRVSLDLRKFLPEDKSRFIYNGSLTTPPCTEGVTWLVFRNPV